MRRSFWIAVTCAAVAVAGLGALAAVLLTEVAACQMAIFGRPSLGVCVGAAWPVSWIPWPLLVASVAVTMSVLLIAVVKAWSQATGARRHVRGLTDASAAIPTQVEGSAASLGVRRLVVVDAPGCLAVTHGLLRPVVVVSTGLLRTLDDDELRAVLAHEAEHVRRRDPLRLLVARVGAAALWPFPVLRDLAEHGALGSEISADRAAAADTGLRPLASALNRVLSAPPVPETVAASSIDGLRHRIRGLGASESPPLELSPRRLAWTALSATVVIAAIAMLTAAALPSVVDASTAPPPSPTPSSSELFPIGDDEGNRIGWARRSDLDELAEQGGAGRVPVYDVEGVQVGWFETGPEGRGFQPLDG